MARGPIAAPGLPPDHMGGYDVDLSQAAAGVVRIRLQGAWRIADGMPSVEPVRGALKNIGAKPRLAFEAERVEAWDSALVNFILQIGALARETGGAIDFAGLPNGLRRLVSLATAVPERKDAARTSPHDPLLIAIGKWAIRFWRGTSVSLHFLGEFAIAFGKFFRGRASFRGSDFLLYAQECGAQALPIVTVISVLIGLIMAFVGAIQLQKFGADIYVANLVVVAMSREMAAVMTAIVLAGRTGAAYAAQIGAMQGNEEVDALTTLGISPVEFLVLPRMLALMVMTPILCVYANLMGLLGGYAVAMGMLNVTAPAYFHQSVGAAHLSDFAIGIAKSAVFGAIVAFCGCLKGIQSGRSAAAVGDAATAAVVAGILYIIVSDGLFAVLLNLLGI